MLKLIFRIVYCMVMRLVSDVVALAFPVVCMACHKPLVCSERVLCSYCLASLPNPLKGSVMEELVASCFWGHVPIERCVAVFTFRKKGRIQRLLYGVKYENFRDALRVLGRYCGFLWSSNGGVVGLDAVVPVPLHVHRFRGRGYNQSVLFGRGIGEVLGLRCEGGWLDRVRRTRSQTNEDREGRYANVADAFCVADGHEVRGKRILLVDDLVTTGATLTSCAKALLEAGARSISIAVLAAAV